MLDPIFIFRKVWCGVCKKKKKDRQALIDHLMSPADEGGHGILRRLTRLMEKGKKAQRQLTLRELGITLPEPLPEGLPEEVLAQIAEGQEPESEFEASDDEAGQENSGEKQPVSERSPAKSGSGSERSRSSSPASIKSRSSSASSQVQHTQTILAPDHPQAPGSPDLVQDLPTLQGPDPQNPRPDPDTPGGSKKSRSRFGSPKSVAGSPKSIARSPKSIAESDGDPSDDEAGAADHESSGDEQPQPEAKDVRKGLPEVVTIGVPIGFPRDATEEESLLEKFLRRIDQHLDQKLVKTDQHVDKHVDKAMRSAIREVREETADNLGVLEDFHYKASKGLKDQLGEVKDVAKFVNTIRTKARDEQDRYDNSAREREKADKRHEDNASKREKADERHEENKRERIRLDALHVANAKKRAEDEAEQADDWEGLEYMLKRNEARRQEDTRRSYRERNEAWERRRSTSAPPVMTPLASTSTGNTCRARGGFRPLVDMPRPVRAPKNHVLHQMGSFRAEQGQMADAKAAAEAAKVQTVRRSSSVKGENHGAPADAFEFNPQDQPQGNGGFNF